MGTKKKKPVPKFYAKIGVKEGNNTLILNNRYYYQKYLNGAFKAGQDVSITIKRQYRNRTTGVS